MNKTYLRVEGDRVKLLHPLISSKYDLLCLCITLPFHTYVTSMIYEVGQVSRIYCIHDVEEELSLRSFLREELVWKECLYLFLCLD